VKDLAVSPSHLDTFWFAQDQGGAIADVDRCTGGLFALGGSHANGSASDPYIEYRRLRTRRVIDYGWRTADLLVDGLDEDVYDADGVDTRSIVLTDRSGTVRAGIRLTRISDLASSLSAGMWGNSLDLSQIDDPVLDQLTTERNLLDSTRMFFAPSYGPLLGIPLLGACIAATRGRAGTLFTAGDRLAAMMRDAALPTRLLATGRIGDEECSILLFDAPHRLSFDDPMINRLLTLGAFAVDPLGARGLPFFDESAVDGHEIRLSEREGIRSAS